MTSDRLCNAHIRINAHDEKSRQRVGIRSYCQIRVDEDGRHPGEHVFMPAPQPVRLCTMFQENPRDGRLVRSCNLVEGHAGEHEPGDVYSSVPIDLRLIGLDKSTEPVTSEGMLTIEKIVITVDAIDVQGTYQGVPYGPIKLTLHDLGDTGASSLSSFAFLLHLAVEKRVRR